MRRSVLRRMHGHCTACGEKVEGNHQCDQKLLARIERATDAAMEREPYTRTTQTFNERLSEGFAMLQDSDYE